MKIYWSRISDNFSRELQNILSKSTSPLTLQFENKHWDIQEILERVKPAYKRRLPTPLTFPIPPDGYHARHGPRYIYVNKFVDLTDFQRLITNIRARKPADISFYNRYLFPRVKGIYLIVGAREILSEYLVVDVERQQFICTQCGVPTEHKIREPADGGELGYLPNIYFGISTNAKFSYRNYFGSNSWSSNKNTSSLLGKCNI